MAQYAIAFDLDTVRMKDDGISDSERTTIYQKEIPQALERCGFEIRIQGSVYRTNSEQESLRVLFQVQNVLRAEAPKFCRYLNKVHIFRVEDISEITDLLTTYVPEAE